MLTEAGGTWIFLRNLDVNSNKPLNVTEDILYGEESMVREAVKNRLWTTMVCLCFNMSKTFSLLHAVLLVNVCLFF